MVSLVIPFYNEADRIGRFIESLNQYKNSNQFIQEIILVNDGSTDDTIICLKEIQKQYSGKNIHIIDIVQNSGKGNALKTGILQAKQDWVLCNDADLSYSFEQIDEWFEKGLIDFNEKETVYFGKRILNDEKSKFFIHRIVIGKIYYLFIRLILGIHIQDTQCGFKLYSTPIAKAIFKDLREHRFAFDLEIIYKLNQKGIKLKILPVRCFDVKGSKVNLIKDSWDMFLALFRVRKLKY